MNGSSIINNNNNNTTSTISIQSNNNNNTINYNRNNLSSTSSLISTTPNTTTSSSALATPLTTSPPPPQQQQTSTTLTTTAISTPSLAAISSITKNLPKRSITIQRNDTGYGFTLSRAVIYSKINSDTNQIIVNTINNAVFNSKCNQLQQLQQQQVNY